MKLNQNFEITMNNFVKTVRAAPTVHLHHHLSLDAAQSIIIKHYQIIILAILVGSIQILDYQQLLLPAYPRQLQLQHQY